MSDDLYRKLEKIIKSQNFKEMLRGAGIEECDPPDNLMYGLARSLVS